MAATIPTIIDVPVTQKASEATIYKAVKMAGMAIVDVDKKAVMTFATHVAGSRADKLPSEKFKKFCDSGELPNNLEMWIDKDMEKDAMLAEFDKRFEKFTPVAQPMYGSSTVPIIGKPGSGSVLTPSTSTPSTATPSVTPPGGSDTNEGPAAGSRSDKDPTKTLARKMQEGKGLSGGTVKNLIDETHNVYKAIKGVWIIDRRLHDNGNPPEGNVDTDPELVKLGQQVATAQALVNAPLKHLKDTEASLRALDTKITLNQDSAAAGQAKMAKHQQDLEKIWSQWLLESTRVEAIDRLLLADNKQKGVLETAVGEAKAAVEGQAHKESVAELKTLQDEHEALANKGKLSVEEINAMKEKRKQHFKVIAAEVEDLKTVVVERHTETDPKDVKILFCGPELSTVEYKVSKAGEMTINTAANPTMGNNNCGTRAMLEHLPVTKTNLAAKKRKAETQNPKESEDEGAAEDDEEEVHMVVDAKKVDAKKAKVGVRTKETPVLPTNTTTKKSLVGFEERKKRKANKAGKTED